MMKGMVSHVNVSRNKKYYSCFQIFVPSYLYVHLCYRRGSMTSGWLELILLWPKQRISHEISKKYEVIYTIIIHCSVPLFLKLIMILLHLYLVTERFISSTCQNVIAKKEIWASCICPYSKFGGNSRFMSHSFLGIINTTTQYHIKPPCRKNDTLPL